MAAKSSDKKNRYFFSKNNIRIDIYFQIIVVLMYCIYYLKNKTFFFVLMIMDNNLYVNFKRKHKIYFFVLLH